MFVTAPESEPAAVGHAKLTFNPFSTDKNRHAGLAQDALITINVGFAMHTAVNACFSLVHLVQ